MASDHDPAGPETYVIRIDYSAGEEMPAQYATHMTAQMTDLEVVLSFFQVVTPLFVGSEEEQRQQFANTRIVRAQPVARVAIAASRIPGVIQVLSDQWKRWLEDNAAKPILGAATEAVKQ